MYVVEAWGRESRQKYEGNSRRGEGVMIQCPDKYRNVKPVREERRVDRLRVLDEKSCAREIVNLSG